MKNIRNSIRAGNHVKVARDVINRLRFGPDAPRSDELIWIDPAQVTNWYKADPEHGAPRFRRRHSGLVVDGDWDRSTEPLGNHLKLDSIRDHFLSGVPWEETPLFDWMMRQIRELGRIDGCRSKDDLLARYARLDRIYEDARRAGTLRPHGSVNATRREHGGILVHIDRDGRPLRSGGGMHRFAIARVLGLGRIPAQLGVVHAAALRKGVLSDLRMAPQAARVFAAE